MAHRGVNHCYISSSIKLSNTGKSDENLLEERTLNCNFSWQRGLRPPSAAVKLTGNQSSITRDAIAELTNDENGLVASDLMSGVEQPLLLTRYITLWESGPRLP